MSAPVRTAVLADAPGIVETLALAFDADPFVRWIVKPGTGWDVRVRRYMDLALRHVTLPHGAVYTTDDHRCAALWAPPGTWDMSLGDQLRLLPLVAGVVGPLRLARVASGIAEVERSRPRGPWWFLALLGTAPGARGQGLGTAVLRPVLDRCDAEGVPALLDTCEAHNVSWYGRRGFRVISEVRLPGGGPSCWTLLREPGAPGREVRAGR